MKTIVLTTIAALGLFVTAAIANQSGWGNGYQGNFRNTQQASYTGGGCPMMQTNMMGQGKMNGNRGMMGAGQGAWGTTTPGTSNGNWRVNPSYQGRTPDSTTGK